MAKSELDKELEDNIKDDLAQKYITQLKKDKFISEIKNGLGAEIKKNPKGYRIIKKTWFQRIKAMFKRFFTNF